MWFRSFIRIRQLQHREITVPPCVSDSQFRPDPDVPSDFDGKLVGCHIRQRLGVQNREERSVTSKESP